MDPTACLKRIIKARRDGNDEEACDAAHDLQGWLIRGGFPPDFAKLTDDERKFVTHGLCCGVIDGYTGGRYL